MDFKKFLKVDPNYPKYNWQVLNVFEWLTKKFRYPHASLCKIGHLTAEGALQHLKLGSYLHEKYKSAKLFDCKKQNNNLQYIFQFSNS